MQRFSPDYLDSHADQNNLATEKLAWSLFHTTETKNSVLNKA